MKLYYSPTSPFVRKVMVVAHETGLIDRIEPTTLRPQPLEPDPVLSKENPLSKIPVLVTGDGPLFDSPVICEYLDTLHSGRKLVAPSGPERFRTLRTQALCDGILESAVIVFYEKRDRPKELQWAPWIDGQTKKATQGLDALEEEAARFEDKVDLGQISAGVTLGWLEFRKAIGDVRTSRPKLFAWYDRFRQRPSMQATEPKG